jgi:hypothetical protein
MQNKVDQANSNDVVKKKVVKAPRLGGEGFIRNSTIEILNYHIKNNNDDSELKKKRIFKLSKLSKQYFNEKQI